MTCFIHSTKIKSLIDLNEECTNFLIHDLKIYIVYCKQCTEIGGFWNVVTPKLLSFGSGTVNNYYCKMKREKNIKKQLKISQIL